MVDDDAEPSKRRRDEPPPLEFIRPGEPASPPPVSDRPSAWVTRPEDFERPQAAWPTAPRPTRRGRSTAAGLCLLAAGVLGMIEVFLILAAPLTPGDIANLTNASPAEQAANVATSLALIYVHPVSILGGITALQRKNWKLAVGCAVVSLLSFGPFLLSTVLGLLGLLFVLTSRPEFDS